MRNRITRFASVAFTALVAGGLLLTSAGAALAANPVQGTSDGMSGEYVTSLDHTYVQAGSTFDLTPTAQQIGVTSSLGAPKGAVGEQLCNQENGNAAEVGVILNPDLTFSAVYALGQLPANPGNPCIGGGILTNGAKVHNLLTHLQAGDNISVFVHEYAGGIRFSARDNSTGDSFQQWVSFTTCRRVPGHQVKGHWAGPKGHRFWVRGHWVKAQTVCAKHHPFYDGVGFGAMQGGNLAGGDPSLNLVNFEGTQVQRSGDHHPFTLHPGYPGLIVVDSGVNARAPWLVGVAGGGSGADNLQCGPQSTVAPSAGGLLTYQSHPVAGAFSICVAPAIGTN
jgi:hypothetical protein